MVTVQKSQFSNNLQFLLVFLGSPIIMGVRNMSMILLYNPKLLINFFRVGFAVYDFGLHSPPTPPTREAGGGMEVGGWGGRLAGSGGTRQGHGHSSLGNWIRSIWVNLAKELQQRCTVQVVQTMQYCTNRTSWADCKLLCSSIHNGHYILCMQLIRYNNLSDVHKKSWYLHGPLIGFTSNIDW